MALTSYRRLAVCHLSCTTDTNSSALVSYLGERINGALMFVCLIWSNNQKLMNSAWKQETTSVSITTDKLNQDNFKKNLLTVPSDVLEIGKFELAAKVNISSINNLQLYDKQCCRQPYKKTRMKLGSGG